MRKEPWDLPLESIVFRALLVGAVLAAVPRCTTELDRSGGPPRPGLDALPVAWEGGEGFLAMRAHVALEDDHRRSSPAVPVLCFEQHTTMPTPATIRQRGRILRGFSSLESTLAHCEGKPNGLCRASRRPIPPLSGSEDEEYCAFELADATFLLVSTEDHHFRIDRDLNRIDSYSAVERLGLRFGERPWLGTLCLSLLGLGCWLVLRQRQVNVRSFIGLVLAFTWLIPLDDFVLWM